MPVRNITFPLRRPSLSSLCFRIHTNFAALLADFSRSPYFYLDTRSETDCSYRISVSNGKIISWGQRHRTERSW